MRLSGVVGVQGKNDEAIALLRRLTELRPKDTESHFQLGNLLMINGELDAAITELETTLRLEPDHQLAQDRLRITHNRKQLQLLLPDIEARLSNEPNNIELLKQVANMYYALGKFPQSIAAYERIIALEPNEIAHHLSLGITYSEAAQYEKAALEYEKVVAVQPNHVYYYSLAQIYERLNRENDALAALAKSLSYKPEFYYAQREVGVIHYMAGRYKEAIPYLVRATQLQAEDDDSHIKLAIAYLKIGDRAAAIREHEYLKSRNPRAANRIAGFIFN